MSFAIDLHAKKERLLGFEVKEDGHVVVNHDHNKFGDTCPGVNPTVAHTPCGLKVQSVFKRLHHQSRGSRRRVKGDNCPLIYALKGKEGLYTTFGDIKSLYSNGAMIFNTLISALEHQYDLIVPMPSSHDISKILAKRALRAFEHAVYAPSVFQKCTVEDVQRQLASKRIPHSEYAAISKYLKSQEREVGGKGEFSIKGVHTHLRHHISPVRMTTALPQLAHRILLVDDLYSSGSTLLSSRNLLQRYYPDAEIEALCLFSPHKGVIK